MSRILTGQHCASVLASSLTKILAAKIVPVQVLFVLQMLCAALHHGMRDAFRLPAGFAADCLDVVMHAVVRVFCPMILHSVTIRIVVPQSVRKIHPVAHSVGTDFASALHCSVAQVAAGMSNLVPALLGTPREVVLMHAAV